MNYKADKLNRMFKRLQALHDQQVTEETLDSRKRETYEIMKMLCGLYQDRADYWKKKYEESRAGNR